MDKLEALMNNNLAAYIGGTAAGAAVGGGRATVTHGWRGTMGGRTWGGIGALAGGFGPLLAWRKDLRNFDRDVFRPAQARARSTCKNEVYNKHNPIVFH